MNMDCFLKRFTGILLNDSGDHVFETLKILTGGTTSPRIAKLLNFAVSQMGNDEAYVEVGVFSGATLCSASYMNKKKCVGIDKYDPEEIKSMGADPVQVRDRCLYNIGCLAIGTTLIEKDFREVTKEKIGSPVAVSFIDGKHDYIDVTKNLEWLDPILADDAILVFDDVNFAEVSRAILDWIADHGTYDLITYIKPFYQDDRYMSSIPDRFLNNGVAVIRYHRNPLSEATIKGVKQREN